MDFDTECVLVFWAEDRQDLRLLRADALRDERRLYAYATRLSADAQRIHHICDLLDDLTVRLSETAAEGV